MGLQLHSWLPFGGPNGVVLSFSVVLSPNHESLLICYHYTHWAVDIRLCELITPQSSIQKVYSTDSLSLCCNIWEVMFCAFPNLQPWCCSKRSSLWHLLMVSVVFQPQYPWQSDLDVLFGGLVETLTLLDFFLCEGLSRWESRVREAGCSSYSSQACSRSITWSVAGYIHSEHSNHSLKRWDTWCDRKTSIPPI